MATLDGFIYGLDELKFGETTLGYISEEGITAGGEAPATTQIRAAQKGNAVVKSFITTPGSKQFTFTLIQLKGEDLVEIFGGSFTAGVYSAPEKEVIKTGKATIKCTSGHVIEIPSAALTANLAQAISTAQTLAISCTMDVLTPETGSPFTISYTTA
ncbi:MAG: hypothetical protein LIO93_10880 [Bacteroidales bacterium]|nr:hypothetical protein [Bacteroidales bacterium]